MSRYVLALFGVAMLVTRLASAAPSAFDDGVFKTDTETDQWLRSNSVSYARIVEDIKSRKDVHGYCFTSKEDVRRGMAVLADGYLEVQLNTALSGADRVTILVFEMANASRQGDHEEIDRAVDEGVVRTAEEFALAHEMIEFEALRLHRQILIELESRAGALPKEFFYFVTPAVHSTRDYQLPGLSQYLKTQKETGHMDHYYSFYRQRKRGQEKPSHEPDGAVRKLAAP